MFVFCFCLFTFGSVFYFVITLIFAFSFAFVVVRCRCYVEKMSSRFNVCAELRYPDTQPHSAHPTDDDIMHKVHFKILCLHATKLEFSCFDGIIMRHTTSGCTYKRDVSRRPCFTSRQPSTRKVRTPLLACLSKVALSHHAITIACRAN